MYGIFNSQVLHGQYGTTSFPHSHLEHGVFVGVLGQALRVLYFSDRQHFLHVDVTLVRLIVTTVVIPKLQTQNQNKLKNYCLILISGMFLESQCCLVFDGVQHEPTLLPPLQQVPALEQVPLVRRVLGC